MPTAPPVSQKKFAPAAEISLDAPQLTKLTETAAEQGDIVAMRRGTLFAHPDAIRDILVTNDRQFGKSPLLKWARWTLGQGLLTADGPLHAKQRPLIQPALHPKRLDGYAAVMSRHAADSAASWRDGQAIDVHHQMLTLTLHIVAEALFGAALGPEVDAISVAMDFNVRAFQRMLTPLGAITAFLPTPFSLRYLWSRHKVISVLRRFVAQRRASGEQRDDLLGRMLSAKLPDGQPAMSERQLIDECVTIFAAGHETTAGALTYTLWLLTKHPDVQTRLADEINRVLPPGVAPTIDDVDRLVYTRQVVSESMRLFPPAWIQGRQALADVTVNGTPVRRGRTIFVSQWVTHRDPRWWPTPEKFDPDRFAPDAPDATIRPRWSYFAFGGGSRVCVGEAFAWAELILVLATLVRRWRFDPVDPAKPLRLEPGITLRPGEKIEVTVGARV
jgi:cytochrome P450